MNSFDDGQPLPDCEGCGEPPMAQVSKANKTIYAVTCYGCARGVTSTSRGEAERAWRAINEVEEKQNVSECKRRKT